MTKKDPTKEDHVQIFSALSSVSTRASVHIVLRKGVSPARQGNGYRIMHTNQCRLETS